MNKRLYSKQEVEQLLSRGFLQHPTNEEPEEDLLIEQSSSRACVAWELANQGFSLVPEEEIDRYFK